MNTPPAAHPWPEVLRDQPRPPDPFPLRLFLVGVLPGVIGAIVLIVAAVYLEQRASRQILYLSDQGLLASIRADGSGERLLPLGEAGMRVSGPASWSSDGSRFAMPVVQDGMAKVLIAQTQGGTQTVIDTGVADQLFLPANPWSDDGAYLALVHADGGGQGTLLIADVQQGQTLATSIALDMSAPISWRAQSHELLVTVRMDALTRGLAVVRADGQPRQLAPQDGQPRRSDAVWSPDGARIAYVAAAEAADVSAGIWIANSDGSGARAIVPDGVNLAPVWAPRGDMLFFTRVLTETEAFELYRVRPDGSELTRVGPSTPAWRAPAIDRGALLSWSPDGTQITFQGYDQRQQRLIVYTALYDGSAAQARFAPANANANAVTVRWLPASRALVIGDPSGAMFIHWVDQERPNQELPGGYLPVIQP